MKMKKPDLMAVLVVATIAGVVLTMFMRGAQPVSSAQASLSETQAVHQGGWGKVRQ